MVSPSPIAGEGCEALEALLPRRSWMRGSDCPRPLTRLNLTIEPPSPAMGRGLELGIVSAFGH